MPKTTSVVQATSKPELNKTHRHSLQPKSGIELPLSSLRHTQSHRYGSNGKKSRKKVTVLSPVPSTILDIPENEEIEEKPEEKKARKIAIKAAAAYDNEVYEANSDRWSGSIRVGSSRASSVQSLEVVREQYCCCVRRTKCERRLLLIITVMSIVIIVLVIVIAIIASETKIGEEFKLGLLRL